MGMCLAHSAVLAVPSDLRRRGDLSHLGVRAGARVLAAVREMQVQLVPALLLRLTPHTTLLLSGVGALVGQLALPNEEPRRKSHAATDHRTATAGRNDHPTKATSGCTAEARSPCA